MNSFNYTISIYHILSNVLGDVAITVNTWGAYILVGEVGNINYK